MMTSKSAAMIQSTTDLSEMSTENVEYDNGTFYENVEHNLMCSLVPWFLTLIFAVVAIALNGSLFLLLHRARPKERTSGILILTLFEVSLSTSLVSQLIYNKIARDEGIGMALGQIYHCIQAIRNYWLSAMAISRMIIIVKPVLGATTKIFSLRQQAILFVFLPIIVILPLILVNQQGILNNGRQFANETDLELMLRRVKGPGLFYIVFGVHGVILPGLIILVTSIGIAYNLNFKFFRHQSTNRTTKIIFLLTIGFILFEFPFAIIHTGTAIYVFQLSSKEEAEAIVDLLEGIANWSGVFVPVDSSLNFMVLMRYSRSLQHYVRQKTGMRFRMFTGRSRETVDVPLSTRRRNRRADKLGIKSPIQM